MKKIIVVLLSCTAITVTHAQTSLSDVLHGTTGKLLVMSGFKQYIMPHLTAENAMSKSSVKVVPKMIILDKDSSVRTMLKDHSIRVVDLQTMIAPLTKSFNEGAYGKVMLSKDVATMVFVTIPNGDSTFSLVYTDIFFSPSKKLWVVNAHLVEGYETLLKGAVILTY